MAIYCYMARPRRIHAVYSSREPEATMATKPPAVVVVFHILNFI